MTDEIMTLARFWKRALTPTLLREMIVAPGVRSGLRIATATATGCGRPAPARWSCACKKVSFADLIVLGGCAAIEKAAKAAGHDVKVPFTPGRMDASQEQTGFDSFAPLEPVSDGFRNYLGRKQLMLPEEALVDRVPSHRLRRSPSSPPRTTARSGRLEECTSERRPHGTIWLAPSANSVFSARGISNSGKENHRLGSLHERPSAVRWT
jgi:hypothetical protein